MHAHTSSVFSRRNQSGKAFLCAVIGGKPLPCQIIHPPEIFCRWKNSEMSHNSKLTLSVSLAPWHTLFSSAQRFRANGGNSTHTSSFTHLSWLWGDKLFGKMYFRSSIFMSDKNPVLFQPQIIFKTLQIHKESMKLPLIYSTSCHSKFVWFLLFFFCTVLSKQWKSMESKQCAFWLSVYLK